MQTSRQKTGVDINAQKRQRGNPNPIFQHRKKRGQHYKKPARPELPEVKMRCEKAGYEKSDARANAAALLGHPNRHARQG